MEDLLKRSVAKVIPDDLARQKLQSGKKLRAYWGIDPTGARLHLGHAVPLRKMQEFADAGHEVIMVIGSFTAMIGDPSGQDAMRKTLTKEDVMENFKTYKKQAAKVLDFSKVKIAYNHTWLEKLRFADILGLASKFTVQQMIQRDMFARRIQEGHEVSVHEFMYPLMVGYDSVMLDVDVEIGGTDQEFNMLAGRTLQKAFGKREKFVLTTKLLLGTDGRKMSKTYNNCVYLEDEPNEMYGKLLSLKDELIPLFMECCTDIPMAEIEKIVQAMKRGENPKQFKMRLAREVVALYHGKKAAQKAEEEFARVFASHRLPSEIPNHAVSVGKHVVSDLLFSAKLVTSKSEARRLIEAGGVRVDERKISDVHATIDVQDPVILQVGRRRFCKVIPK